MADISKIVLGSTTYNIKDTVARAAMTGGMHFLGVSLSAITDASNSVAIIKTGTNTANRYYTGTAPTGTSGTYSGTTYTLKNVALTAGDVVIYGRLEFVFSTSDNCWHELGSTGSLGSLAYKSDISVTYSKATGGTLVGTKATIIHKVNQGTVSASGSYTPKGTITNDNLTTKKVSSGVNTSKLAQTTIYPQTISAPTGEVKVTSGTVSADSTTVATANATATSVLTGLTGTKTFVTGIDAVKASYANETLTLAAATTSTNTVTASSTNITGVSGTQEVLSKLTGITTFATGLTGTTTFVKSATLSTATTGGTTVATGKVASTGTGDSVAISSNNDVDAITALGTITFTGTAATVSVTGTTSGITVDDHSYTPEGSVTVTNSDASATVTLS